MNLPFALKWYFYFKGGRAVAVDAISTDNVGPTPTNIKGRAQKADALSGPTAKALLKLHNEYRGMQGRFLVVITDDLSESLATLRLCMDNEVPYLICPIPAHERIPGDGHFNALGHARLAESVFGWLNR